MIKYLLDSDFLIWCLRDREESVKFFRQVVLQSLPACSSLSILEVELGMRKGEEQKTQDFLDSLQVVSVTKEIARQAAFYIRFYKTKGRYIDFADAAIAASCIQGGFTLITYNLKHYPMPELQKTSPEAL